MRICTGGKLCRIHSVMRHVAAQEATGCTPESMRLRR